MKYVKKRPGSSSAGSSVSQATGQSRVFTQSPTQTVLPKPAGADTSVICRPASMPSFRRWTRWGRWVRLGGIAGGRSLVASRWEFTIALNSVLGKARSVSGVFSYCIPAASGLKTGAQFPNDCPCDGKIAGMCLNLVVGAGLAPALDGCYDRRGQAQDLPLRPNSNELKFQHTLHSRGESITMAKLDSTKENPWVLKTTPGTSEYTMHVEDKDNKRVLVCTVGKTILYYDTRCIDDLYVMLKESGDWVKLGGADEQKPAKEGTVEAWGRSPNNPVKGWYGLKKGLHGHFGVYIAPLNGKHWVCVKLNIMQREIACARSKPAIAQ